MMSVISFLLYTSLYTVITSVTAIILITLTLAGICSMRNAFTTTWSEYLTCLYIGRVSHTRFKPVVHSFSYPLFFCCVDLKEVETLFQSSEKKVKIMPKLWPLSLIMQFRSCDHLKNGEGIKHWNDNGKGQEINVDKEDLKTRVCNLIEERTRGKYKPSSDQTILLLTHLSYYGYCFNPVSFYYVMKPSYLAATDKFDGSNQIEAIVAEVSNTPWNEMQCYVLHPDSIDITKVQPGLSKKITEIDSNDLHQKQEQFMIESINYVFDKSFHVSPFMDMKHIYDWTFYSPTPIISKNSNTNKINSRIIANTSMRKKNAQYFNAHFDISRSNFTPISLCYQLIRFPFYCMIIQLWIHIEAFQLFMKGVEFVPHPSGDDSQNLISKTIAFFMMPLFALQDWWQINDQTKKKQ